MLERAQVLNNTARSGTDATRHSFVTPPTQNKRVQNHLLSALLQNDNGAVPLPIVTTKTGFISGSEASVPWHGPGPLQQQHTMGFSGLSTINHHPFHPPYNQSSPPSGFWPPAPMDGVYPRLNPLPSNAPSNLNIMAPHLSPPSTTPLNLSRETNANSRNLLSIFNSSTGQS
jgi:hypothetical protein